MALTEIGSYHCARKSAFRARATRLHRVLGAPPRPTVGLARVLVIEIALAALG
jgi:hypothetical protein